jgi:serine/threonine protein phosphatase PrpC
VFPPDEEYETLQAGDAFLLCSDGLVIDKGETADERWGKSLVGTRDLKAAAEEIVLSAYSAGSTDNITVVLATYGALERTSVKRASALPTGR